MTEIFREIDESLTYDRLIGFWRSYRIWIVCSLVIGVSVVLVWQIWQEAERRRLLRSGELFFELLSSGDSSDGTQLVGGYKTLWSFKRARDFFDREDWRAGHEVLQRVIEDGSIDRLYSGYARLWQASNSIKRGNLESAERVLSPLAEGRGGESIASLQALALYLRASIAVAQDGIAQGGQAATATDGDRFIARAKADLARALSLGAIAPELRARLEQAQRALGTK